MRVCFFFQAEDGIRDYKVTGVQTCALPIFEPRVLRHARAASRPQGGGARVRRRMDRSLDGPARRVPRELLVGGTAAVEIGRASCRERGEIAVVRGGVREGRSGAAAEVRSHW